MDYSKVEEFVDLTEYTEIAYFKSYSGEIERQVECEMIEIKLY